MKKSCIFFTEVEDVLIARISTEIVHPNYEVLKELKKDKVLLTQFLKTEREIFLKANLSEHVAEEKRKEIVFILNSQLGVTDKLIENFNF